MTDCTAIQERFDDLLDGGEDPALEAHLAGCPGCRAALRVRLRQHRLLLEHGCGTGEAMPRLPPAPRRRRARADGLRPLAMAAALAAAVLTGWWLLRPAPPSDAPAASPVPALAAWPWLELRTVPGTRVATALEDGVHRVRLADGRARLASGPRPPGVRLDLVLGPHRAELLGTSVDAAWDDGRQRGFLRVTAGRVALAALTLDAGQEVHLVGDAVLPPLATLPGTAWEATALPPPGSPRLVLASELELVAPGFAYRPDPGEPGGGALVAMAGRSQSPLPRPRDQMVQARVVLPATEPRWDLQALFQLGDNRHLGILLWGTPAVQEEVPIVRPLPEHFATGARFWMPAAANGETMTVGSHDGRLTLQLMAYRPGARLSVILLRPLGAAATR